MASDIEQGCSPFGIDREGIVHRLRPDERPLVWRVREILGDVESAATPSVNG